MAASEGGETVTSGSLPAKKRHRGIPEAIFLEDVDDYMQCQEGISTEGVLAKLDEQYQKYKFMEVNLVQKRHRLKSQIPDIKTTLDAIEYLKARTDAPEPVNTQFLLSDQLYVNAVLPATKTVCLWLGANVMLEYDINEAESLLTKNVETAKESLGEVENDINFLRDQITTTEVSILFKSQACFLF
eukprot:gene17842-9547_t